jgi:peptidylprolyl isomerase
MDRRVLGLIVFGTLAAVIVGAVLIGRAGDSGDSGSSGPSTDTSTKPEVQVPDDPPPDQLVVKDIVTGEGQEAKAGDQVTVDYVGVDYESGEQFDASWDSGQTFPFRLGGGEVIPGWDQGVEGMRVGGRRELIIPPDLAYGAQGQPPSIAPNATLVFVIDLRSIE